MPLSLTLMIYLVALTLLQANASPLNEAIHLHPVAAESQPFQLAAENYKNSPANTDYHLAGFGFRTKYQPQQFYASARAPLMPVAEGLNHELTSMSLMEREDICKGHCDCKNENNFSTVVCDFRKNRKLSEIFDSNFKIPLRANRMIIKLAPTTHLRLEGGFFNNNKYLNSFTIQGAYSSGEQVELTSGAFDRNHNGPYPDIQLLDVHSVLVREGALNGEGKLNIQHSKEVVLFKNAFENGQWHGGFVQIEDLRIHEKAFNTLKTDLVIESSHIEKLYRFEVSLRDIRFSNCTIDTIDSGTFDVNNINSIKFENSRIGIIKARAITDKLLSKHVSITGVVIGTIEGEAIYGSGINTLILTKNEIDTIQENAIHVNAINVTIAENVIKHARNNWLRVKEWSNVIVEKNTFGDFGRIALDATKSPLTCRFSTNSLTRPLNDSLDISSSHCLMHEIVINEKCTCNNDWLKRLTSHDLRSETYCKIDSDDSLINCFNSTTFNTLKFLNVVCDEKKDTIDCVANRQLKRVSGKFLTPEELEQRNKLMGFVLYIVIGIACLILLILVAIAVYCTCRCVRKSAQSASKSAHGAASKTHIHEFSEADKKEFSRTLEIMEQMYPKMHKQIKKSVKELQERNLPYDKCQNIIIKIADIISKENAASHDLKNFQNVLMQHLQQSPTAPPIEIVGAENALRDNGNNLDDGFYASSSVLHLRGDPHCGMAPTPPSVVDNNGQVRQEEPTMSNHIYEELLNQPLLQDDYAAPMQTNGDNASLYAVPVDERDMQPPAYAVSSKLITRQPIPLHNLPSTPLNPGSLTAAAARNHNPQKVFPNHRHQSGPPVAVTQPQPSHLASTQSPASMLNNNTSFNNNNHNNNNSNTNARITRPGRTNVKKIASDMEMKPNFSIQRPHKLHMIPPPTYSDIKNGQHRQFAVVKPTLASPEIDDCELDMRGAAALPPDVESDHSGGSNETVKIDDIIEYADA